jgi:DNA-directed RNA polymerase specialized sigma24 family protein
MSTSPAVALETALQAVWEGRTLERWVQQQGWPEQDLGLLQVPTFVQQYSPGEQLRTWPVVWDPEPGTPLPAGQQLLCSWRVTTDQVQGTGQCVVGVGVPPDPQGLQPPRWSALGSNKRASCPQWLQSQIPASVYLPPIPPTLARRQIKRKIAQGQQAQEAILQMYAPILYKMVQQLVPRLHNTGGAADQQDLVQRGQMTLVTLLQQFASPQRPRASWMSVLRQNLQRDLSRAMAAWSGESLALARARAWLWHHPEVHSLQQAREAGVPEALPDSVLEAALRQPHGTPALYPVREPLGDSPEQDLFPGVQDPWLSSDPAVVRSLRGLLQQLGISWEQALPWLYRIGVFDYPHPRSEVIQVFGISGYRRSNVVEARFFGHFAAPGEDWGNPLDRPAIRERARQALCQDGSLRTRVLS